MKGDVLIRTIIFIVLLAAGLAAALFTVLFFVTQPTNAQEYFHIAQTVVFALTIITGAGAAAIGYRTQRLKEVDATNRRFAEATRSLRNEDKFVSIEGVYALERLALNAPNNNERVRVVELLCAHLREKRKIEEGKKLGRLDDDHEAIIAGLVRICGKYKKLSKEVNLSLTNLRGANLICANLICANLSGANLIGANLIGANLICANLIYANLSGANLIGANLSGANLIGANLIGANLIGATLSGADLRGAVIDDATEPDNFFEKYGYEITDKKEKYGEHWTARLRKKPKP